MFIYFAHSNVLPEEYLKTVVGKQYTIERDDSLTITFYDLPSEEKYKNINEIVFKKYHYCCSDVLF